MAAHGCLFFSWFWNHHWGGSLRSVCLCWLFPWFRGPISLCIQVVDQEGCLSLWFVLYGGLCSNSMNKLAGFCCVLFSLFVCACVCVSCLTDSLIDSLCVLIPVLPESPVVLFSPFFRTHSFLSHFLFLSFSLSQSCRLFHVYIHTHIQSLPHIHV